MHCHIYAIIYIYMYITVYKYLYVYFTLYYMYMSHGSYFVQNAIDGVFLPCSPILFPFLGSDLVPQCLTCFY